MIVTGASSGIGEACAKAFSQAGAHVVLAARNRAALEKLAESLPGKSLVVPCDITGEEDCQMLVNKTIDQFSQLDVLVNNAGISMRARFMDAKMDVIEKVMQTNFWGSVYCSKYALPHLLKTQGQIVVMSTTAGFVGLPGRTAYSASKFALHGFFDTLYSEHRSQGLHIAMIFPGFTASNIRKNALDASGQTQGYSPQKEEKMTSAETVAEQVIKAVKYRKRRVLIGIQTRLIWWIRMFLPDWLDRVIHTQMKKESGSPL